MNGRQTMIGHLTLSSWLYSPRLWWSISIRTADANSRWCLDVESRYAIVELEAVEWAFRKCCLYLSGLPTSPSWQSWISITGRHRKPQNGMAEKAFVAEHATQDALSRAPVNDPKSTTSALAPTSGMWSLKQFRLSATSKTNILCRNNFRMFYLPM